MTIFIEKEALFGKFYHNLKLHTYPKAHELHMRGNETYRKEPASHYDSEYQVGVEHGVRKET
jgi:hypothetical protein